MMSDVYRPQTPFILSLIGGILILIASIMGYVMMYLYVGSYGHRMMGGFYWMMGWWFGYAPGLMFGLTVLGVICGLLVIVGAAMLSLRPLEHRAWGVFVLVFSVISFIDMGGFFVGAILGIVGGALSISLRYRPESPSSPSG